MIETIIQAQTQWQRERLTPNAEALAQSAIATFVTCARIVAERLTKIGYPVSPLLGPVYADVDARIHRLKLATGVSPPKVLSYLWQNIGSIQFTDYLNCSHDDFWTEKGLGRLSSDGLHICSCEDSYVEMYEMMNDEDKPTAYLISLDIYEKDNCSGGGGVEIDLDSEWSPTCRFSDIPCSKTLITARNCDLVTYLRTVVLECGCFPGMMGRPNFEPIRKHLTDSLPLF
jgi:hypothetical protein